VLHLAALRGAAPARAESGSLKLHADVRAKRFPGETADDDAMIDVAGCDRVESDMPGLEEGTWIEVRCDDGGFMRGKLVWCSPQSGVHLFVDRRGCKVLELAANDIEKLRQQGALTILGDSSVVDRAIEGVLQTLKGVQET
jgi:hypothetical protein